MSGDGLFRDEEWTLIYSYLYTRIFAIVAYFLSCKWMSLVFVSVVWRYCRWQHWLFCYDFIVTMHFKIENIPKFHCRSISFQFFLPLLHFPLDWFLGITLYNKRKEVSPSWTREFFLEVFFALNSMLHSKKHLSLKIALFWSLINH